MKRTVHCAKLNIEAEGLETPPYPGPLGQKIYEQISKEAWQQWLNHQTILINEYRLNMLNPDDRKMLVTEMENFLFGQGSAKPEAYSPIE